MVRGLVTLVDGLELFDGFWHLSGAGLCDQGVCVLVRFAELCGCLRLLRRRDGRA